MIKILLAFFLIPTLASAMTAESYLKRPKLVVVIVIDQFRADMLTRNEKKFLAAGSPRNPGGFRFLMEHGAWAPFAEYSALQDMTCPGHATILTGSNPASHGIGTNDWYDVNVGRLVYCTEDAVDGRSPRRLLTSTVGDELKSARPQAHVVSIALKDRAAIMLGGHLADKALWMDEKSPAWTTSKYYNKGFLQNWIQDVNESLKKISLAELDGDTLPGSIRGTELTFQMAAQAVKNEKLGRGPDTDLLAISLSNHDILGHHLGPDSTEIEKLTFAEDRLLADFLGTLQKEMKSLDDVVIVLTGDHGIPPSAEQSQKIGLPAGRIDMTAVVQKISKRLDEKFKTKTGSKWILNEHLMHLFLNRKMLSDEKLEPALVQQEIKRILAEEPGIHGSFTLDEFERGAFPPGVLGTQLRNTFLAGQSGDVIAIAKPYFYEKGHNFVTHLSGWSYDRSVPLLLYGRAFKAGVYSAVQVVDLAPTLTFVLGVLPPALNEGRVLSELLR